MRSGTRPTNSLHFPKRRGFAPGRGGRRVRAGSRRRRSPARRQARPEVGQAVAVEVGAHHAAAVVSEPQVADGAEKDEGLVAGQVGPGVDQAEIDPVDAGRKSAMVAGRRPGLAGAAKRNRSAPSPPPSQSRPGPPIS